MERQTVTFNGTEHEVCASCGCVVGHGCPESEPCECVDVVHLPPLHFNPSVDLDRWLPVISDAVGDNQPEECGRVYAGFDREEFAPRPEIGRLFAASPELLRALLVFVRDPRLRALLRERDPKALEQAEAAVGKAGVAP